ncbi:MAG TPA: SCO family protein, partial [Thermoanaerobaculia bacterium]|nr:SCO family protein [Thermoanaerobaculia bacterium]
MMAADRPDARRLAALLPIGVRLGALLLGALLVVLGWAPVPAPGAEASYTTSAADYRPPDVTLVDQAGARVRLADALSAGGPVLVQFIFTSCSTICPVLSGTFAAVQGALPEARLVSISIDPDVDTPARLAEYARRFKAGPRWRLLGGRLEDVIAVESAFDAYRGNKMRHEPLTFIHPGPRRPWLRLEG